MHRSRRSSLAPPCVRWLVGVRGLPVLFPYVALPAIDVQAFPKAVLATGKYEAIKNPHRAGLKITPHLAGLGELLGSNQTGNDEAGDETGTGSVNRVEKRQIGFFHHLVILLRSRGRYGRLLHLEIQHVYSHQCHDSNGAGYDSSHNNGCRCSREKFCQSATRKIDRMDKCSLTFSLIAMAFCYAAQLSIKPSVSSSSWAASSASFTWLSSALRMFERHRYRVDSGLPSLSQLVMSYQAAGRTVA